MKAIIFLSVSVLSFASQAIGSGCGNRSVSSLIFSSVSNEANINHSKDQAGRGCCSHHSGVCGCSKGSAVCCDGTLSPTCGC